MQGVVLLSRRAAGYDTDRCVFLYEDRPIVKFYGSRLTDTQIKSLFFIEEKEGDPDISQLWVKQL